MKTTVIVVLFVVLWTLASLAAVALPLPSPFDVGDGNGVFSIFLALHLLLAASLGSALMRAVFRENKTVIFALCTAMAVVFIGFVAYGRMAGTVSAFFSAVHSALLLSGATMAGALLSSAVKRLGELIPVCCTAAIADLVSVAEGPTSSMIGDITAYYQGGMRGEIPLVDFFLVKAGIPGYHTILPVFGVTDWILVSLLSASLLRLGKTDNLLPQGKIIGSLFFPITAAGLLVSLIIARFTDTFIPAMAVIATIFLLYITFRFDIRRELRRSDLAYSLVLPSCVVALVLVLT